MEEIPNGVSLRAEIDQKERKDSIQDQMSYYNNNLKISILITFPDSISNFIPTTHRLPPIYIGLSWKIVVPGVGAPV